jgi:KDO2-lipid IV(A) lauroyltransferase
MQTIEYILVKILYEILRRIPFTVSVLLAYLIAFLLQYLVRYRKKHVISNLKASFPDIDNKKLHAIVRDVYVNFCMLWIELLQSWRLNEKFYSRHFKMHNFQIVEKAYQENKGLIMFSGHMGNFEWMGYYIATKLPDFHVIMRRIKNPRINDFFFRTRRNHGINLIYTRGALKDGIRVLKAGKMLGIVADQDAGSQGIFVDFMGRSASTARGGALFHLETGAPMIFAVGIRKGWGKFDIYFERIPDTISRAKSEEHIFAITQAHTQKLEKWVREYPGQYFWTHKRWKTVPSHEQLKRFGELKTSSQGKYFKPMEEESS